MPLAKFFYPRLTYNAINIDFPDPVTNLRVQEPEVRLANLSTAGVTESLSVRSDFFLILQFAHLSTATLASLRTFWRDHGRLMKQSAITLDRLLTCAGQYEFDQFNTFFTKAELQANPFAPTRSAFTQARYQIELLFRQGT